MFEMCCLLLVYYKVWSASMCVNIHSDAGYDGSLWITSNEWNKYAVTPLAVTHGVMQVCIQIATSPVLQS